ncbi:hypothetical protein Clacol_007796 [Clathrus columnatus]|uniref:Uncharacterized protein n=1 Tax=Clathrus columnatus TaxID=1419009 RepID=A0AAV5AIM2_9AGAM|nr:hypothetical protein Clacol_007796 [Clathrus columnatus]
MSPHATDDKPTPFYDEEYWVIEEDYKTKLQLYLNQGARLPIDETTLWPTSPFAQKYSVTLSDIEVPARLQQGKRFQLKGFRGTFQVDRTHTLPISCPYVPIGVIQVIGYQCSGLEDVHVIFDVPSSTFWTLEDIYKGVGESKILQHAASIPIMHCKDTPQLKNSSNSPILSDNETYNIYDNDNDTTTNSPLPDDIDLPSSDTPYLTDDTMLLKVYYSSTKALPIDKKTLWLKYPAPHVLHLVNMPQGLGSK